KHTDYGGGRVLVCAVDRGLTVRAEAADGPPGTLEASTDAFPGALRLEAGTPPALPAGHWGRYVHTVLARLTDNFGPLRSARLTVSSDLPPASGMSSSSAMITGAAMALADLNDLPATQAWSSQLTDRMALAGYAASIENGKSFGTLARQRAEALPRSRTARASARWRAGPAWAPAAAPWTIPGCSPAR